MWEIRRTGEGRRKAALWSWVWVLAWASPLLLWTGAPEWIQRLAWAGVVAWVAIAGRLLWRGFQGYERGIGWRIIRREQPGRWSGVGAIACAIAVLLAALALWFLDRNRLEGEVISAALQLPLVLTVSAGTFFGLLFFLARRFSIFATLSICGVVIGVASLVVVQSVATGFQHEFEGRVRGVYAHINVTQHNGIRDYRRFEAWLRTLPGVSGVSPFAYNVLALAPHRSQGKVASASVLVKGIDPKSADQVIDLLEHLERGSRRPVPLTALQSDALPRPVAPVPERSLPPAVAAVPRPADPAALAKAAPVQVRPSQDDWVDPPMPAGEDTGQGDEDGSLMDKSRLPTVFVGSALAKELSIKMDDIVRLVTIAKFAGSDDEPDYRYFRVAGIFHAGFQEYDSRLIYLHIHELMRAKYGGRDIVSGLDLRLQDPYRAPQVGEMIGQALGGRYSVLEWQDLNDNLFSSIRTQKNVVTILWGLVSFVASFNVLSALWTMVVRRTPEIAIIVSMGATGREIARIFQVTGLTIGLAGSLAGVVFGLMNCWLVQIYGYSLDPEVYFIEELPVEVSVVQLAWILGLSLLFCYLATIPPSLRAARMRPVEGLRYE